VVTPYISDNDLGKIYSLIQVYMVNVFICASLISVPGLTLSGKLMYNLCHWKLFKCLTFTFKVITINYWKFGTCSILIPHNVRARKSLTATLSNFNEVAVCHTVNKFYTTRLRPSLREIHTEVKQITHFQRSIWTLQKTCHALVFCERTKNKFWCSITM
jgi:hypothetical protein